MSTFYQNAKSLFLKAGINLTADDIRICLVNSTSYSYNPTTDTYFSNVPAASRVATSGSLTGCTVSNAMFNANNVSFPNLSGATVNAIVVYKNTGTESTSPLIAYLDQGNNLPFVPDGNNLTILWATGTGIFSFY